MTASQCTFIDSCNDNPTFAKNQPTVASLHLLYYTNNNNNYYYYTTE